MSIKKINWQIFLFFLFALTISHFSFAAEPKRIVSETLLSNVAIANMVGNSYIISPDLRRISFCVRKGDKMMAVVDNVYSKLCDKVSIPVFSGDGKNFVYIAQEGNQHSIIVNHEQVLSTGSTSEIITVLFRPDNKTIVFLLKEGSKYFLVDDGVKSKPYDFIDEHSIAFSPDKSKIAFVARLNGKQMVVYNGKQSKPFEQVGFPVFSPDGKRMAFWAANGKDYYVLLNNKKSEVYDAIGSLQFSRDSKHFVYNATFNGLDWILFDKKKYGRGYQVIHSLTLSPDASKLSFGFTLQTTQEYTEYVSANGKREGPYEQVITGLVYSPDGKSFAYCAQLPIHEIINGVEEERMDIEWFMMYNGVEQKRYNMLQGHPVFSPDSKHFAYSGERESKRYINADSVEGKPYDDIYYITYTPDSKRLIYTAEENDKDFVVVDEHNGKKYDDILGQYEIQFDSSSSFHYIARKGNDIYLVEEKLE